MITVSEYPIIKIISGIAHLPYRMHTEWAGARRVNIYIFPHENDMGLLMGKSGKTIKALQVIARGIAREQKLEAMNIILRCEQDVSGKHLILKTGWDENKTIDLLVETCEAMGYPCHHQSVERLGDCTVIRYSGLPEPVSQALNTAFEAIGRSYGKKIGLSPE